MVAFMQQTITAFQTKIAFCLFRDKIRIQNGSHIFESVSSQLMFYLKNSGTCIGLFRENIFKNDIRTTLS